MSKSTPETVWLSSIVSNVQETEKKGAEFGCSLNNKTSSLLLPNSELTMIEFGFVLFVVFERLREGLEVS